MRILITGAGGLLGLNLALEARKEHQVIGVDRCKLIGIPFELLCMDLLGEGAVEHILDQARPDSLIHCAALANLEDCETHPELASRMNAELPGKLAFACRTRHIRMIHISTDAVFDGTKNEAYDELDTPHPLGVYAQTKLEGERNVLALNSEAIVVRVNFYGFSPTGNRSLAEFFINNLMAGKHVKGFTDVTFNPTFVGDLADLLIRVLEMDLHGLYHCVGATALSKYDFGVAIARRFGWDEALISRESVENSGLSARRAHNLALSIGKLTSALNMPGPEFSTGLVKLHDQFVDGYPELIHRYLQPKPTEG